MSTRKRPAAAMPKKAAEEQRVEKIRFGLAALRDFLRAQIGVPGDVCEWAADAIGAYLTGEAPSLDHSFGLVRKNSRPPDVERRFPLAVQVWAMRRGGMTWNDIVDFMARDGAGDERRLRRLVEEWKNHLIAGEISSRLDAADPGGK